MIIFKCLKCKWKEELNSKKYTQCPKCRESHFFQYYESCNHSSQEMKGGDEEMQKQKEVKKKMIEKQEKTKIQVEAKEKKKSFVDWVKELKGKKTPEEISAEIQNNSTIKCTVGRVNSTLKYLETKKK